MHRTRALPAIVIVLIAAALGSGLLAAATRWAFPTVIAGPVADGGYAARTRAWFTARGFYGAENAGPDRHFSWTGAQASITISDIDRRRPYRIGFRIASGRGPDVGPPPYMVISVDGVPHLRAQVTADARDYVVDAPASQAHTLRVTLDLSDTFTPGPQDRRALGVIVDQITMEAPAGGFRPSTRILLLAAAASAAAAAALVIGGVAPGWAAAATLGVIALQTWLLCLDAAFLGDFAMRSARIWAGACAVAIAAAIVRRARPAGTVYPEWPQAIAVAAVAAGVQIALFAHTCAPVDDSLFQVHRAQAVHAGQYFFTSITPRPFFEFPYAIALYVTALPFWRWAPTDADRVLLLRALTVIANAIVGAAFYFPLRRATGNRATALLFVALWPFARGPFAGLCTGNLTNVYGQGLFGAGLAAVATMAAGAASGPAVVTAALLITGGFLSHFSTLSVGLPIAGIIGLLLLTCGRGTLRRTGLAVLGITVVAGAVAYAVYYSHFPEVYRRTIHRIASGEGAAEARSMAAPVAVTAARWRLEVLANFGLPTLIVAPIGAALLIRQPRRGMTLVLGGWLVAWAIFSIVGILTPIQMRADLAAAPLLLALAVIPLGALAGRHRFGAAVVALIALAIVWSGVHQWMQCLTA